jgi:hypothetical protein
MKVVNSWAVVMIDDDGIPADAAILQERGQAIDRICIPHVMTTFGPFTTEAEAWEFVELWNRDYDGSPYSVVVRPMSRVEFTPTGETQ